MLLYLPYQLLVTSLSLQLVKLEPEMDTRSATVLQTDRLRPLLFSCLKRQLVGAPSVGMDGESRRRIMSRVYWIDLGRFKPNQCKLSDKNIRLLHRTGWVSFCRVAVSTCPLNMTPENLKHLCTCLPHFQFFRSLPSYGRRHVTV